MKSIMIFIVTLMLLQAKDVRLNLSGRFDAKVKESLFLGSTLFHFENNKFDFKGTHIHKHGNKHYWFKTSYYGYGEIFSKKTSLYLSGELIIKYEGFSYFKGKKQINRSKNSKVFIKCTDV